MRVLVVLPDSLGGASGLNVQKIYSTVSKYDDCEVAILAPFSRQTAGCMETLPFPVYDLRFEGHFLSRDTKKKICNFFPDIVHVWGNRHWVSRAALETSAGTGALLVVHMEDDDQTVFAEHGGIHADVEGLTLLDKPVLSDADIKRFTNQINWEHFGHLWHKPDALYGVEPVTRALCMRLANGYSAIWNPMKEALTASHLKPCCIVPPAVDMEYIDDVLAKKEDIKTRVRAHYELASDELSIVFSGTKYRETGDVELFLNACCRVIQTTPSIRIFLVGKDAAPSRTAVLIRSLGLEKHCIDIGLISPEKNLELLAAADVLVCPGTTHTFNRMRLPTRMAEFMAMKKPIFTYRTGFGESLEDGVHAVLTQSDTLEEWTDKLQLLVSDASLRASMGIAARQFAEQHFSKQIIADRLRNYYKNLLAGQAYADAAGKRLSDALDSLASELQQTRIHQVALYGAGKHTQKLLSRTALPSFELKAILDDSPSHHTMNGIPVYSSSRKDLPQIDAIIVSSDTFEEVLYRRACDLFPNTPVYKLYNREKKLWA